jgi:L-asparagine oxygenase
VFPTQESSLLSLTEAEGKNLFSFLTEHSFNPFTSDEDFEQFVDQAFMITSVLPEHILASLLHFRRNGNDDGVLIIRGLPIDNERIGSTPHHWSLQAQTKYHFETELYLIGLASILGEVFSFRTQHEGNIIQNIVPIAADMYEQIGTGSQVFLEWHTEEAFHMLRADYIGLLCLRADPQAATTFSSLKRMSIPECYKQILFERRFRAGIDKAHGGTGRAEDGPIIAILSGRYDEPDLRIDTSCICALPGDHEAIEALEYLKYAMNAAGRQIILQAGDILFMDNFRLVHGRTMFIPRFDGTDRWLQRVSIATDFRKSYPYRTRNFRVIEMHTK